MKLRLKQLAFDSVQFKIAEDFDPQDYVQGRLSDPMGHDVQNAVVSITYRFSELDKEKYSLGDNYSAYDSEVTVSAEPKKEAQFPYIFSVTASGLFFLEADPSETDDESRKSYVRERAIGHLIGPIRETIREISAKSYFGDIIIPPINPKNIIEKMKLKERASRNDDSPLDASE